MCANTNPNDTSTIEPIYWTLTDEAPLVATASLLPYLEAFLGVPFYRADISLGARILAAAGLGEDALSMLGRKVESPGACIIKLPNISASTVQIKACVKELQEQGHKLPETLALYDTAKGSAVNPVLRQGNSKRFAAAAIKNHALKHPHKLQAWSRASKSCVRSMERGGFYDSEKACLSPKDTTKARVVFYGADGSKLQHTQVQLAGRSILDTAFMSRSALRHFYSKSFKAAKQKGLALSLHLKCTMMKNIDPLLFGDAVREWLSPLQSTHPELLAPEVTRLKPENGLEEVLNALKLHGKTQALQDAEKLWQSGPLVALAREGQSHLHVPNNVIIDASMPALVRWGGQYAAYQEPEATHDTMALVPDPTYASIYAKAFEFFKNYPLAEGVDVRRLGHVSNIGLMAFKAQEYGCHSTCFVAPSAGEMRVELEDGTTLNALTQRLEPGDIWRLCRTQMRAVKDWLRLAVSTAQERREDLVFWLDPARAHDSLVLDCIKTYAKKEGLSMGRAQFMAPADAMAWTLERWAPQQGMGQNVVAATGNVLRDYLTDFFPILELGTSAKMLSIVPLLAGGGLFETGAGGTAPSHMEQFLEHNHLRWDSLGEFLALQAALETRPGCAELAQGLGLAAQQYLAESKAPKRQVGAPDTRHGHFYLLYYWAKALARMDWEQSTTYAALADAMQRAEGDIVQELGQCQGQRVDVGGYYHPDWNKLQATMQPSPKLNKILKHQYENAQPQAPVNQAEA